MGVLDDLDSLVGGRPRQPQPALEETGKQPKGMFDDLLSGSPTADTPVSKEAVQPEGDDVLEQPAPLPPGSDYGAGDNMPAFGDTKSSLPKIVQNIPGSAVQFGADLVQPFMDPVGTATAIKDLGKGVLQKTGLMSGDDAIKNADAVGQFLVERYGSLDAVKKTLEEDPVGFMGDLSTILSGGGFAAARAPGLVGKVGKAAQVTGRAIDPLTPVLKTAAPIARGVGHLASESLGALTGTGGLPIEIAAKAGYKGGDASEAFKGQMRGTADIEEVNTDARRALAKLREQRSAAYEQGMIPIKQMKQVLPFDKIDDAIKDIAKVKTFHGKVIDEGTQAVREKIGNLIDEWRNEDKTIFHTPEGLDALKQAIYNLEVPQTNRAALKVQGDAARAVRDTIIQTAGKEYSKVMKAYGQAEDIVRNVESSLSLGRKTSTETTVRKLQSVLRNNVSSAYGHRLALAQFLVNADAPLLMEKLAGQAMNSLPPRGLSRVLASAGLGTGVIGGILSSPMFWAILPLLAASSPRVVGSIAHGAGKAARPLPYIRKAVIPSFQAGRLDRVSGEE